MKKLLIASLMILPSCGFIKGCSKSPIADRVIKEANESYVDDNFYEELLEDAIESTTGLEVDFSPETIENQEETQWK